MRVALLQHNAKIGDIASNFKKISDCVVKKHQECELFVSSELALSGYPPRDLLSFSALYQEESKALEDIRKLSESYSVGILVGHHEKLEKENRFYNCATLFDRGKKLGSCRKQKLASYNVFEEERFYVPAKENPPYLEFRGTKLGISICEDLWDLCFAFSEEDRRQYDPSLNPMYSQTEADFLINLSASPFRVGKNKRRLKALKDIQQKTQKTLVYVNSVGAQDELIFEGASKVITERGALLYEAPQWQECSPIINLKDQELRPPIEKSSWESLHDSLVLGIRDYLHKSSFSQIVLGLSGGVDSALIAALATEALGSENVFCFALPSRYTSPESKELAQSLAQNLNISLEEISIQALVDLASQTLSLSEGQLAHENLQSRIRGNLLMAQAQKKGALLLATGNKCEYALGYATLYGDIAGALAPIGDLYKTEVIGLCHFINRHKNDPIPERILTREPTAELRDEQKDSDSLPPYAVLDSYLKYLLERSSIPSEFNELLPDSFSIEGLEQKMHLQEFKRFQAPPILRVHQRSFGAHWKMPLVKKAPSTRYKN